MNSNRILSIVGYLAILLGVVHEFFLFKMEDFGMFELWFMGSGIAIILAGLINLIVSFTVEPKIVMFGFVSNLIICLLFVFAFVFLQQPQVIVGFLLFAVGAIASLRKKSQL